jgi:hypothetical protein
MLSFACSRQFVAFKDITDPFSRAFPEWSLPMYGPVFPEPATKR